MDGFPIGGVTAFAGSAGDEIRDAELDRHWLLCDGAALPSSDERYQALFLVIGFSYGGSEAEGRFRLPDYRGLFLRGADRGAGNDPDASGRLAVTDEQPRLDGTEPEPAGDKVGTIQGSATARPKSIGADLKAQLPQLPVQGKRTAKTIGKPQEVAAFNDGEREIDVNTGGGDQESRPVNVSVNYFIKVADSAS